MAFHLFQDDVNSCGIELYRNKDPREQVKLLVNDMRTLKILIRLAYINSRLIALSQFHSVSIPFCPQIILSPNHFVSTAGGFGLRVNLIASCSFRTPKSWATITSYTILTSKLSNTSTLYQCYLFLVGIFSCDPSISYIGL